MFFKLLKQTFKFVEGQIWINFHCEIPTCPYLCNPKFVSLIGWDNVIDYKKVYHNFLVGITKYSFKEIEDRIKEYNIALFKEPEDYFTRIGLVFDREYTDSELRISVPKTNKQCIHYWVNGRISKPERYSLLIVQETHPIKHEFLPLHIADEQYGFPISDLQMAMLSYLCGKKGIIELPKEQKEIPWEDMHSVEWVQQIRDGVMTPKGIFLKEMPKITKHGDVYHLQHPKYPEIFEELHPKDVEELTKLLQK